MPGNIQAVTEAPILARADGYIKRRLVDIGDRVQAGQILAEIEAPELDQQVRQAQGECAADASGADPGTRQLGARQSERGPGARHCRALGQAGRARAPFRKQENDQYQAQYQAQAANLDALEQAVAAARSNIAAAEANLSRLDEIQSYRIVKAPFEGVITLRNVDVGALVNAGSTLLYRIAQTRVLRTYRQRSAEQCRFGSAPDRPRS